MGSQKIGGYNHSIASTSHESHGVTFSLIGFEELGNSDVFDTDALELRLSQSGESTVVQ